MARDVPFDENEKCDLCGTVGAFDFMGDYLCPDCANRHLEQAEAEREAEEYERQQQLENEAMEEHFRRHPHG